MELAQPEAKREVAQQEAKRELAQAETKGELKGQAQEWSCIWRSKHISKETM
jgi:hypothetical protein